MKLTLLTAATLTTGVVAIGGLLLVASRSDGSTGATLDACTSATECGSFTQEEYATLEEAAADASFQPMMPGFIPEGFEQKQVYAKRRDFSNPNVPEVHNDWITATYRDGVGRQLVISQGFPAMVNARFAHPDSERRTLEVSGRQALWSDRAILSFPSFNPNTDVGGVLTIYVGRFDYGWGQEGSWFSGSPMEYSIGSNSLGLSELVAIAESVTFSAMVEPNEGFSPEPYFE